MRARPSTGAPHRRHNGLSSTARRLLLATSVLLVFYLLTSSRQEASLQPDEPSLRSAWGGGGAPAAAAAALGPAGGVPRFREAIKRSASERAEQQRDGHPLDDAMPTELARAAAAQAPSAGMPTPLRQAPPSAVLPDQPPKGGAADAAAEEGEIGRPTEQPLHHAPTQQQAAAWPLAPRARLHVTNADLGITHLVIPHLLFPAAEAVAQDAPTAGAGNLHLWLKHLLIPGAGADPGSAGGGPPPAAASVFVRGALFFESAADPVNPLSRTDHHYRVPIALYVHVPQLVATVQVGGGGGSGGPQQQQQQQQAFALEVEPVDNPMDPDRPWAVWGSLPAPRAQGSGSSYSLTVQGWPRGVAVPVCPAYTRAADYRAAPPSFHFVVAPYAGIDAGVQAQLLLHHIDYHTRLGFAGWLAYVRGNHLPALAAHPGLAPHVASGALLLLAWEDMLHFQPARLFHPDQAAAYNHAVVAFSGRNAYLALADLDEYVAAPRPVASIGAALARCGLPPGSADWTVACLSRRNVYCGSCPRERPELEAWLGGDAGGGSSGGGGSGSRDNSSSSSAAVKHPLQRYDVRAPAKPFTYCKAIVQPDRLTSWFVHGGRVFAGLDAAAHTSEVPDSCLGWLHVEDLLWRRPFEGDAADTSWHWIFEPRRWGAAGPPVSVS